MIFLVTQFFLHIMLEVKLQKMKYKKVNLSNLQICMNVSYRKFDKKPEISTRRKAEIREYSSVVL